MDQREITYLRHQQQRFMRPDAARYLRPDTMRFLKPGSEKASIYPALTRKYEGQPRIPEGEEGGGQFTFGTSNAVAEPNPGVTRVHIERWIHIGDDGAGDGEGSSGSSFGNDLDSFLLAAAIPPGIGHNQGPSLEEPPEIPDVKPARGSDRTAVARAAANWISAALGAGASIAAAGFIGILNNIDWLQGYQSAIKSYRDPPRTLEELQDGVGQHRPGYEDHHIIERTAGQRWGLSPGEINDKSNVVSIPRLKHYQITGWFQKSNSDFGGLSPRAYLSNKGVAERRAVGLRALELYEVLKQ